MRNEYGVDSKKIFEFYRRTDQTPPIYQDWTTWLLMGGRGAGKTRTGAEWVRRTAYLGGYNTQTPPRIALIAETYADAREVMIEGPSGLRAIASDFERPVYEASRRRLVWPSGAVAYCFSAEDPDGLRGYQFDAAWADEMCKWRHPEETWSNLQLALRIGSRPRQVVTTTPRPMALLKRIINSEKTAIHSASSYANRENLAEAFFSEIVESYEGTALGRQELLGELIEDLQGALWNWSMIEAARISLAPDLDRVVVAVDPPAGSGSDADECGIIVAGAARQSDGVTGYVLADWSVSGLSPSAWGEKVIVAAHEFQADRIIIEVNQGGDMARHVLTQIDPNASIRSVHASRGKRLRAEPIAALYERGRVRHVGGFAKLEDQMTTFTGMSQKIEKSPDRLDALVWALTDLLLRPAAPKPGIKSLHS